jgi:hypothetical protein
MLSVTSRKALIRAFAFALVGLLCWLLLAGTLRLVLSGAMLSGSAGLAVLAWLFRHGDAPAAEPAGHAMRTMITALYLMGLATMTSGLLACIYTFYVLLRQKQAIPAIVVIIAGVMLVGLIRRSYRNLLHTVRPDHRR